MNRLLSVLFWLFLALDIALLGLWFVLGLAASKPSHTPLLNLLGFFALPTAVLLAVLLLYLRGPGSVSRGLATVLAGLPALVVVVGPLFSRGVAGFLGMSPDHHGRPDPVLQQKMESAIRSGDAQAVARIAGAPQARLNDGAALVAALRQLEQHPDDLEPLRALLKAGVKPSSGGGSTDPLAEGIRVSRWAGPEPVRLLLDAGADPNQRLGSQPAWFAALSPRTHADVLPLLLAHGADLNAVDMAGSNAMYWAVFHQNWAAGALLVERGARWQDVTMADGQNLRHRVEAQLRSSPDNPALRALVRAMTATPAPKAGASAVAPMGRP